ncbi:hypothetical protein PybrP1_000294 [[Pythium] brassicae (nom. inval.)]|nr:hypothetical protein PybrP1_000294 [[Pythium] brassicae (nom. inval.)]
MAAHPLPPLRLRELLSACFSAGSLAGHVIRDVVRQGGDLGLVNKADDKYDPQTVADRRSQQRIVHALRHVWPHVQIVGEEGELAQPAPEDALEADVDALCGADFAVPEPLAGELSADDVVLWIDPLDGTKKFAEKKYDEVSVLIGVAYRKRPVAGVMHLPFAGPHGATYWGGPGIGLFVSQHEGGSGAQAAHARQERPALRYPARPLAITTSGTRCNLVELALEALQPARVQRGGATGTMVLSVITGASDLFLRFRNATKRWDICAVEPLLEAVGGALVDKRGRAYEYDPRGDPAFDNDHGLIVALDAATTKWAVDTMADIELLRTLDGTGAMTPEWLARHVFHGRATVTAARIVPGSTHRGKQSSVAKLRVECVVGDTSVARTLFVKRYVKSELPPRSAAHWRRDLRSYRTESRFYAHFYDKLRVHVALIAPLAVLSAADSAAPAAASGDGHPTDEATDRFLVILESINDNDDDATAAAAGAEPPTDTEKAPLTPTRFVHADCLSLVDAKQALEYLAQLHSGALKTPGLVQDAATALWASGGWWSFAKRGGAAALADTPSVWRAVLHAFAPEVEQHFALSGADAAARTRRADLQALGDRMVRHAAYVSAELFERSPAALRTIVHGDFKSANLFFEAASRDVVAFDWQWCGVGVGALDVAYLLNTSVSIDALSADNELLLLRWYYDRFAALLGGRRASQKYPFDAFQRHYVLATLEYARVLISDFWRGMTPASCAAKLSNTNCGLGYRSVPHVLRMIEKLDEGLALVEQECGKAE